MPARLPGGVQVADPVQLDERVEPEERRRPEHLDPGQGGERAHRSRPARWAAAARAAVSRRCLRSRMKEISAAGGRNSAGGGEAERDQGRGGERGREEEADAAAGLLNRLIAAALSPASRRAALPAAGWNIETPIPDSRIAAPDRAVAGEQAGDAQPEPGQADPGPGHPARVPSVGDDAEDRLRERAAERGRQREPGGGDVTVVPVEDEVGHDRRHQALVEVVDRVRERPQPHAPPGGLRGGVGVLALLGAPDGVEPAAGPRRSGPRRT